MQVRNIAVAHTTAPAQLFHLGHVTMGPIQVDTGDAKQRHGWHGCCDNEAAQAWQPLLRRFLFS